MNNKNICMLFLCAASMSAFAQSSASQTASTNAAATNQGNSQNIVFTSPPVTTQSVNYSGEQTIKNVPSVNGPLLTTSNDTCMGSTTGSLNVAGLGIGGGSTWVDKNCKMLKNSRELWNMGMKAAAMALMCADEDNRVALEVTGYSCPKVERKNIAGNSYYGNDPIVVSRLTDSE
jgi:hypothetical protein